ncbi:MAG: response regulator [Planctomycetota bacterium]|nr:response regulator [Planctomycetota bacterium]
MPTDANLGRIIAGRYRVRRLLGAGAHGRVYLAEDLGRGGGHVALKLVEGLIGGAPEDAADDLLRRFRHPRWAAVLDQGERGGDSWFQAVHFVRGTSLDQLTEAQPVELVWRLLEDGARVLGALHRIGLIHYDVTPGNVMLSDDGGDPHFVLTDGGLAHLGPVRGVARGTPMYMAPEVTDESGHDHRADLYALGLVAYRLATGRDPFQGGAGEVLGKRRRQAAPRASTFRPDLPEKLDDLLAEILERDPNARPHDALALLQRIDELRPSAVPAFLHAEGVAAAEGGRLVGRNALIERFGSGLGVLEQRVQAGAGRLARARLPLLEDPVLILAGAPGSGCTRMADECFTRARDRGVPAILMSGRETTGDRRGPLRHLVDGMAGLGLGPDDEYREIRLDLGTRRGLGREERAHALTRAVEAFVRGVETTAERTPFVLVIEDFPDLPQRAQEATRVLARHLLARRESGGATLAPPVLLLVDMGDESPDSLLVADANEPQRPVERLEPLSADEVARICLERFPGLEPVRADVERIHEASEGLPGVLVALMAEGCHRGDLRHESGRWNWNVDALSEYDIERGLGPVHADALRAASEPLVQLLGYLSLVESPIEDGIVQHLWAKHAITPIPATPLMRTVARGDHTYFTTTNLAIRKAVLARLPDDVRNDLATHLLEALDQQDNPETALDRARLAARLEDHARAIRCVHARWHSMSQSARLATQDLLAQVVKEKPSLLQKAEPLEHMSSMLEHGSSAISVAKALAGAIRSGASPSHKTATSVCRALWAARLYEDALGVLRARKQDESEATSQVVERHIWEGELLFWLHREADARQALEAASNALRATRGQRRPELVARHLTLLSQSEFLRGNGVRALRALKAAQGFARGTRRPSLRARLMNSMGIVLQQLGDPDRSRQQFYRALKLRSLLGDTEGVIGTTLNLGRAYQFEGALVKGASKFQAAASVAQRFAHHGALAMALRFLAQTYDQQHNGRLATATFVRVAQLAERVGNRVELMQAAWELAPLAAAMGDHELASAMLRKSALLARGRATGYARATHHLVVSLTALHLGNAERAFQSILRAQRLRQDLFTENASLASLLHRHLAHRLGKTSGVRDVHTHRPEFGSRARPVYRTQVWVEALGTASTPLQQKRTSRRPPVRAATQALGGRERRVVAELLMYAARTSHSAGEAVLSDMERHLVHTGERYMLGRALAAHSCLAGASSDAVRAQQFSRAVELADTDRTGTGRLGACLPDEHLAAHDCHSRELGQSAETRPTRAVEQHALAHRLLVHHGCTSAPDGRVASALRRVLAATGRMNAGAGLDDLLAGMTQDTIEITGAERACVVLVDANSDTEMRVATSASAEQLDVDVEDLSKTVIQRVIDSQTPLLMHDVFDDEELMGRPSITSLSLRSILCVPMIRSETLYGVLYADSTSAAGSFDGVDQEVLSLFAEQAAAALETHRLVADVQNSMHELKAMQERLVKGERLRTMGELSSGVAHEFNNLLTSILARVQLISLNNIGRELKQELDLIEKACMDAAEVVRRLQSYTRRQRQEHFDTVNLGDICGDAVEFLRPLWSTRRRHGRTPIHVKLRAHENLYVNGNATELREVITNLLKNALDALVDGGDIDIRATRDQELIRLVVEDNGPGIPEDIRSRIFDPFFTTKGERGTGLGLCLSQQIVDRHGGEIVCASREHEGTKFTIELPSAESASKADVSQEQELAGIQPSMRILVVDDDENVRKPLARFLERSGYDVLAAQDGEEAESLVLSQRPDIVITDVAMPGVNGLELCRRLKRESPDMPIVLMSGWTSGVDPARARRAGATALLAKPFALQQVSELLNSIEEAAQRA